MKWVDSLRKLKNKLFSATAFPTDIDSFLSELDILESDEMNEYEKSYCAYRLKNKYLDIKKVVKILKKVVYSFAFVFFAPVIYFHNFNKGSQKAGVIYYEISNNEGILPYNYSIRDDLVIVRMGQGLCLDKTARGIINECFRYSRGNLAYMFEVLYSLANYSYIVNRYHPKEIVTTYEASPIVAILTYYCHLNKVKHTNFMHGEKLLSHCNMLGVFDEMYIWDGYYKELFIKLKYKCEKYTIYNPWKLEPLPTATEQVDYKFYLKNETDESIKKIAKIVNILIQKDFSVKIRPHPSQIDELVHKKCFPAALIESSKETSILQSIANTKSAISQYSTVLFQAYIYSKEIVIDDISDKKTFNTLKKMGYIMLSKEIRLLSEILYVEV